MFKPGISANAVQIIHAIQHPEPAVRAAICENILTFADLEDEPACVGFVVAFASEDRAAQIRAANAMARNGILEPRDLEYFRASALEDLRNKPPLAA